MIIGSNNQQVTADWVTKTIKSTVKHLIGTKMTGDTPTDAKQLVPKQYLDNRIASVVGGSPAGSNTQIQFNNAGAFGASADLRFDDSTDLLSVGKLRIDGSGSGHIESIKASEAGDDLVIEASNGAGAGLVGTLILNGGDDSVGTGGGGVIIDGGYGAGGVQITGGQSVSSVIAYGDVYLNANNIPTNATNGFIALPHMNGTPTGTPGTSSGLYPMVYDYSANKLWIYVFGSGWKYTQFL